VKILHIHNYHAGRGGLEVIYEYTTRVLRERGHEVIELSRDSASIDTPMAKLGALASGVYSTATYRETRRLIEAHRPSVAYVHNVYPMLSTSVFDACHDEHIPVVMDVQDYKMTCPMGRHLRDGAICTKCKEGSVAWSAVHACKGGRLTSAAYALTHGITRIRRAYQNGVDLFVTPAKFVANYLVSNGIDRSRIAIVPNMCDLPTDEPASGATEYAAFVGRLSPEKGVDVLVDAAELVNVPTCIAGAGDLPPVHAPGHIKFVGPITREALPAFYRKARFIVVPSVWHEVYPVVIVEAMLLGIPIIASDIGGMPEMFENEKSGLLVPPGDAPALAEAMSRLWADPDRCRRMGQAAREFGMRHFSRRAFHDRLIGAFRQAIDQYHPSSADPHTLHRPIEAAL
jgi:glycosyltransferase involved in cell wall biosynthesis